MRCLNHVIRRIVEASIARIIPCDVIIVRFYCRLDRLCMLEIPDFDQNITLRKERKRNSNLLNWVISFLTCVQFL